MAGYRSDTAFSTALRPLSMPFDFNGRSPVSEAIAFLFFWFFVSRLVGMLVAMILSVRFETPLFLTVAAVQVLAAYPLAALVVRRLHDQGRTGRWAWLLLPVAAGGLAGSYAMDRAGPVLNEPLSALVPFVIAACAGAAIGYFMLSEGDDGPNAFGEDPRDLDL